MRSRKSCNLCRLYNRLAICNCISDRRSGASTFPIDQVSAIGLEKPGCTRRSCPRVYKMAELKELVAYADVRGVTIVPESGNAWSHSGRGHAIVAGEIFDAINPDSKQPVGIGCMNLSNEAPLSGTRYPYRRNVRRLQVLAVFSHWQRRGHLGPTVASTAATRPSMAKHELKNDSELADHFVREVCAQWVKKHGQESDRSMGRDVNYATQGRHHHVLGSQQHRSQRGDCARIHDDHLPVDPWVCRGKTGACIVATPAS